MFNESMILLAAQTLFVFTDFESFGFDPSAKYTFGWYLSGIMLFTVLVNLLISLYDTLGELFATLKRLIRKLLKRCKLSKRKEEAITVPIKPLKSLLEEEDAFSPAEDYQATQLYAARDHHKQPKLNEVQKGFY